MFFVDSFIELFSILCSVNSSVASEVALQLFEGFLSCDLVDENWSLACWSHWFGACY